MQTNMMCGCGMLREVAVRVGFAQGSAWTQGPCFTMERNERPRIVSSRSFRSPLYRWNGVKTRPVNWSINPDLTPDLTALFFFSSFNHVHSEAVYYAGPIPSFRFCSGRKNKYNSCKIETGFLRGDGARVIRFFARVIQQLRFWTSVNSSQRRLLLLCPAPRRVHFARPWTQTSKPLRSDFRLARRFTWYFF